LQFLGFPIVLVIIVLFGLLRDTESVRRRWDDEQPELKQEA
jgi:hypothetical protein